MAPVVEVYPLQVREVVDTPFRYFLADRCLDPTIEAALLDWFEDDAPWTLVIQDFYEQFEFSVFDARLPNAVAPLVSVSALNALRSAMETTFGVTLKPRVDLVAHKLITGQRIAIHNDYLPGHETHRLTIQLNRGLSDEDGGFFMLFSSFDAANVHRVLRPLSGTGLGFEIDANSHHAVSRMHRRERYTLVYSFHARRG